MVAFFAAFATVIAAVLRSGRRLDHRIDKLDTRIDGVDAKMDSVHHQLVEFHLETREEFGRVHAQLGRHEEKLALWERFIWARTAPELLGAEAEQSHSITPKAAG